MILTTLGAAAAGAALGGTAGIGIGVSIDEFPSGLLRKLIWNSIRVLAATPAVVLGWFGALLFFPVLKAGGSGAAYIALIVVMTFIVMPETALRINRTVRTLVLSFREAAAAAGASRERMVLHAILPALRSPLRGAAASSFVRLLGESTAAQILLIAFNQGAAHSVTPTLGAAILGGAALGHADPALLARPALALLGMCALSAYLMRTNAATAEAK